MKKFIFTLEQVLRVRKVREKQKQRQLAESVQHFEREKEELDAYRRDLQAMLQIIKRVSGEPINPARMTIFHKIVDAQKIRIERQQERVKQAREILDLHRQEMLRARKERKVLEKLKDSKLEQYLLQAEREEQKKLDQVAIMRYSEIKQN